MVTLPTSQAASNEPSYPVSSQVVNHLSKVAGELMEAEVRIYEQGMGMLSI